MAALLPAEKQRYGSTITGIDADSNTVTLQDGSKIKYNKLLTTIPLDITLTWLGQAALAKVQFNTHTYTNHRYIH